MMRFVAAFAVAAATLALAARPADAHPLGNFTVNRYSRVELDARETRLFYVLDLAEIPTLQELAASSLDADAPEEPVRLALLAAKTSALADGARLEIGGAPIRWTVESSSLALLPGQAGLRTLRIELSLVGPAAPDGARLGYRDGNYPGRTGWHEVVLRATGGLSLSESSAPAEDRSDALRRYPADPALAPPDVNVASAVIHAGAAPGAVDRPQEAPPALLATRLGIDGSADLLSGLLRPGTSRDPLALLAALAVAAGLGAFHALGPGHGKTIVAAYLVGSRGTARHALALGATVTATHTAGVYALGLVTLAAAQVFLPEKLYPVLGIASGAMVVTIGLALARSRIAALRGRGHASTHTHDHDQRHADGHDHGHSHEHRRADDHGPVSVRSILGLGVAGGALPCPTALVVLLAAVSFHDVALGMALVAAFSVGLAAVLTTIGFVLVGGTRALRASRFAAPLAASRAARLLPTLSALAVAGAGVLITLEALRTLA